MPDLYFEDFVPGQVYELGSRIVSEDEIVSFGRQWDPQPFHVDPEAAKESVFSGLIASGWHTGSIWMRGYVETMLGPASQGSLPNEVSRRCSGNCSLCFSAVSVSSE